MKPKKDLERPWIFLDTNIEKPLKTFSDTLQHAGECMRRKVSFSTGAERSTCKWFDRECISKKRDAQSALNRFQRTQLETDKPAYRQKRTEYKSTIAEKKKTVQNYRAPSSI